MARGVYRVRPVEQYLKYPRRRFIGTAGATIASPSPTTISGVGTVFGGTELLVATPSFISGTGTVQSPAHVGVMQIAVPDAIVFNTGWFDELGGSVNIFASVDESLAIDSDYITASL